MRLRYALAFALPALVACDAGQGISYGPPELAVRSGDGQTAQAAELDSLDQPVTAQLYRSPETGGITFRIGPAPLYAQQSVRGVVGEVVCAAPIGPAGLEPWAACDETGADGMASFFFEPGTIATDSACAEIRAVVDGAKTVTDVVCATVAPGPLSTLVVSGGRVIAAGDTFDIIEFFVRASDAHGNVIDSALARATTDSHIGWAWYDGGACTTPKVPTAPSGTGWAVTVPSVDSYCTEIDGTTGAPRHRPHIVIFVDGVKQLGYIGFVVPQ